MSHRNKQFDVGADRITILSRNFVHCGIGDMLKIFFARLPVNGGSWQLPWKKDDFTSLTAFKRTFKLVDFTEFLKCI